MMGNGKTIQRMVKESCNMPTMNFMIIMMVNCGMINFMGKENYNI